VCVAGSAVAQADTVYLKNGRSIEGVVTHEAATKLTLDVGFGTVTLQPYEIERITRSSLHENALLYRKWELKKQEMKLQETKILEIKAQEEKTKPKEHAPAKAVSFEREADQGHMMVDVVINGAVSASLLLDTGASLVVLSPDIGRRLGLDTQKDNPLELKNADGRTNKAYYVILETVRVQDVEAHRVPAAIMHEAYADTFWKDGILGMSFLKEFNFRVDQNNKKIILERAQ
jgi:clan AA aspartic protease (TIGR02281 family)